MKNNKIRTITRTGLLLAVVIAVQLGLRSMPYSNFIVGPIINMCLLTAALTIGLEGGITIAILSPFTSLLNNNAPIAAALFPFAPVIAAANIIFVLVFYFFYSKNKYLGAVLSSVIKFGVLFISIRMFLHIFSFPKFAEKLIALFGFPQLITALIGTALALPVIIIIKKATKNSAF